MSSSLRSRFPLGALRSTLFLIGTLGLCVAVACNPQRLGGDDDDETPGEETPSEDPPGKLTLNPDTTDVTINGMAQTVNFRAASPKFGDVTSKATWTLSDSALGSVEKGAVLVSSQLTRGGTYRVYAMYRNSTGAATINVKLIAPDVVDASAPPNAKDYFGGASGGPAPNLVYPFDGTLMAPNILQLGVQWSPGSGQTVYRIQIVGPTYERSFYVGSGKCPGSQCTFELPDMDWSTLGHSSLGKTVTMTVSGSASIGGPVGTSKAVNIQFSPEDVRGGLYYFSPTIRGIKRVPLGASKPVDFITNGDETGCAGCHAVSRDGKQVAVEFGSGQTRTGSTVVDGAMPKNRNFALRSSIAWNFAWFNPTGDKLITNWSGTLIVRDPKNGQQLEQVTTSQIGGAGGAMPEWSPDGKWIAFVRQPTLSTYDFELNNAGDIVIMPYNNGAFGSAIELVHGMPNSQVHFWPSWSPDSKWLVFNTFDCSGGCNQYNAQNTRLRLIRAIDDAGNPTSGAMPIELAAGTHEKWKTNNWPKFAPFLQADRYVFVVYSASYRYGFKGGGQPQLFMFGLDLDKARAGMDPSYQPIWLPFQDPSTGNHSAIWTTDVVCLVDKDCPGEFRCTSNKCVPKIG